MNRSIRLIAIGCALVASTGSAQTSAASPRTSAPPAKKQAASAPSAKATPAGAPAAEPAAAPVQGAPMPDPEKLEAATDNLARIRAALKVVTGRAEQARSEKDVVKLNCVNEKLVQIKALLKVAEQSDAVLRDALALKKGAGETEISKLAIARTKVDGLRRDAEQCIGQLAYLIDEKTTIEVVQPPNLAGRDGSGLGVTGRDLPAGAPVGDAGAGVPAGAAPCGGRGTPFCPPPVVRPPDASPSR